MIQGFQTGLKLIQKGGRIKLIVPSALAYGCKGYGSVPGNSILYFEVELIDVL
jgi:FKBP-type peptidyl-prolyl cis-trans isomerase FkpA